MADDARVLVEAVYRQESRRVLATLIRLLGDFDTAEEALHDAFVAAANQWTAGTVPKNPYAWLVSAGRFKAIDKMRKRGRFDAAMVDMPPFEEHVGTDDDTIEDDRLRLIFTCCHPALPQQAQMAMTLREVCGLTTEEIARAFLTGAPTVAQRIVRAKAKIREHSIPYETPPREVLAERAAAVLHVVYLVFNEGYSASAGAGLLRSDLSAEAIRLGRLLMALLPSSETMGVLALMLLNDSRRNARVTADGDLVLMEDQDRALWDHEEIAEGLALAQRAMAAEDAGPYALQAAIAAEHAMARNPGATRWDRIVVLYDRLLARTPSPVIALNRAVAVGMRDGPPAGVALIDALLGELDSYHLAHAARADFCRRLGDGAAARSSYERALALCSQESERRFYQRRLREL